MMIMMMTLIGNYDIKDSGDSQIQTTKFFVTDLPIERSLRFHNTLYPSRLLGSRSKEAAGRKYCHDDETHHNPNDGKYSSNDRLGRFVSIAVLIVKIIRLLSVNVLSEPLQWTVTYAFTLDDYCATIWTGKCEYVVTLDFPKCHPATEFCSHIFSRCARSSGYLLPL